MIQFDTLGLAAPILRAVQAEGYTAPTPIQAQAVPALLAGRDVLGIAQTGTGKTAAFVLPLLDRLARDRRPTVAKRCRALILAPTRELAAQIADSIRAYGRHTRPRTAVVIGGVKAGPQIKALASGVDIVVATPGRLEDHLASGTIRLDKVSTAVLDEADQMLDLGFLPAIRRIMAKLPGDRQTVLFSATMPKPIRALAHDFQSSPEEISVAPAARPIDRIDQRVIPVDAAAKRNVLTDLLRNPDVERALVFTRTKRGADRVRQNLERAGLAAGAIHGDKSQGERERALAAFRSGRTPILVATDIAARGIDIDDVSHVVNYELPHVPESYVHRIGRTARAGKAGVAIALCDPAERGLLRDIERLIGRRLLGDGGTPAEAPRGSVRAAGTAGRPDRNAPKKRRRFRAAKPSRQERPSRHAGEGHAEGLVRTLRA